MRLSRPRLTPLPASEWNDEQRELLTRGNPSRVLNVFATLVRHQDLYRRWMPFANHVLFKSALPPREREMAILRIGWLCRSGYEFHQHTRIGKQAGLSDAEIERLKSAPDAPGWTEAESALLRAVDELHGDQFISDATWQLLGKHYDTRQVIDLVFAIGQYTMVSMALNSLGVQIEERDDWERDPATIWTPPEATGGTPGRSRLTGRRILVVGAGSQPCDDADAPLGNGRAISVLCAREGASVACVDRDEAAASDTAQRIASEGNRAVVVVADVTDETACARLVADAEAALGGLDGIAVNVGIGYGRGLEGTDASAWDLTFAINLRAHFLIARAALPRLQPGAAIVFVSSIAGIKPGTSIPAYDASKAGLAGLCRHVAFEGARRGIRANLVVPGLIDTPLGARCEPRPSVTSNDGCAAGKARHGVEVAYATVFLLGAESSYVTGQQLVVDGGLSSLR